MNNKKVLTVLFIVIFILVLILFLVNNKSKRIELIYETNGGVPYTWKYIIEDKDIVKLDKSFEIENNNKNGMTGALIKTKYVFKGLKEGKTKLIFRYVSIVDKSIEKEDIYNIEVDKNKNISIKKKK